MGGAGNKLKLPEESREMILGQEGDRASPKNGVPGSHFATVCLAFSRSLPGTAHRPTDFLELELYRTVVTEMSREMLMMLMYSKR